MNVPGHHFLTGAGLAQDQHVGLGIGHLLNQLPDFPDRTTVPYKAAKQLNPSSQCRILAGTPSDIGQMQGMQQLSLNKGGLDDTDYLIKEFSRQCTRGLTLVPADGSCHH